jgi:coproporphyrinogen III oxidase
MVQSSSQTTTRKKKIRFFQKRKKNQDDDDTTTTSTMAWFGGGADLTPYYLFPEDITSFHQQYRDLCNRYFDDNDHDHSFGYTAMKKACDDYFYLPARQEHRGTGGIFFDDLPMNPQSMEFVQAVARLWMPSWFPIVQRRSNTLYTEQQKYWQKIRRGRYLEFNLLYDVRTRNVGILHGKWYLCMSVFI